MKNCIVINNLSFKYSDRLILNKINLTIQKNSCIGILGPNGGGKTTFFNLLLGLLKPLTGCISIFGHNNKNYRKHIALVPQRFHFDPNFPISVKEVVLMGRLSNLNWFGQYSKEDHLIADKMIDLVDLSPYSKNCFSCLSGGQAQRVLIARALASHPKVLLLDEPTSNIDLKHQKKISNILSQLKSHLTIIMITHDPHSMHNFFDHMFCLNTTLEPITQPYICSHNYSKKDLFKNMEVN